MGIVIINQTNPAQYPPVPFDSMKLALLHWQENMLNKETDRYIIAYHDGSTNPVSLRVTKQDFTRITPTTKAPRIKEGDLVAVKSESPTTAFLVQTVQHEEGRLTFTLQKLNAKEEVIAKKRRKDLRLIRRAA